MTEVLDGLAELQAYQAAPIIAEIARSEDGWFVAVMSGDEQRRLGLAGPLLASTLDQMMDNLVNAAGWHGVREIGMSVKATVSKEDE